MEMVVGVALPFFAVLMCGFLARRLRILDEYGVRGLNAFVYWFALPALLFWRVAETPFSRLSDPTFYLVYEGSGLVLYGLVFALVHLVLRRSRAASARAALATSWGNGGDRGVARLRARPVASGAAERALRPFTERGQQVCPCRTKGGRHPKGQACQ